LAANLILASSSAYRRALLQRLAIAFTVVAPGVDETALFNEAPVQAARRLSLAKARAVAALHPDAWVIGSDQTATLDGQAIIGKPGNHANATQQLRAASGRVMQVFTGLALVNHTQSIELLDVVPIKVRFRALSEAQIQAYLQKEQPYDCAGSVKSEALGVAMLAAIETDDPSALVGLPLIRLCDMLLTAGFDPIGGGHTHSEMSSG
jgi:septum formation protein